MSTAQQEEIGSQLGSYKIGPKLFPSNTATMNNLLYPFISPQPASAKMKNTKSEDAFSHSVTPNCYANSKYHSQCKCSSNSTCKARLTHTHSPGWPSSLTFRESKFINRQHKNNTTVSMSLTTIFLCQPRHLLLITSPVHMVRTRIYINRKCQSYGMTVYMPGNCMSHSSMIALFQAILLPMEIREKLSLLSCQGPAAKLHCANKASLVLTLHTV